MAGRGVLILVAYSPLSWRALFSPWLLLVFCGARCHRIQLSPEYGSMCFFHISTCADLNLFPPGIGRNLRQSGHSFLPSPHLQEHAQWGCHGGWSSIELAIQISSTQTPRAASALHILFSAPNTCMLGSWQGWLTGWPVPQPASPTLAQSDAGPSYTQRCARLHTWGSLSAWRSLCSSQFQQSLHRNLSHHPYIWLLWPASIIHSSPVFSSALQMQTSWVLGLFPTVSLNTTLCLTSSAHLFASFSSHAPQRAVSAFPVTMDQLLLRQPRKHLHLPVAATTPFSMRPESPRCPQSVFALLNEECP